jgi:hypothetical protein
LVLLFNFTLQSKIYFDFFLILILILLIVFLLFFWVISFNWLFFSYSLFHQKSNLFFYFYFNFHSFNCFFLMFFILLYN